MTGRRGFTLVEVLVALALIALLSVALGAFTWDLRARRASLRDASEDRRAASALFERVEDALATCVVLDRAGDAGVRGAETELRLAHRGVRLSGADAAALGDHQVTTVRFDEQSGLLGGSGDDPGVLSRRVQRLRLRYHDGDAWRESYDSLEAGRLPAAVEVAIWFAPAGMPAGSPDEPNATPPIGAESLATPDPTRVWPEPDRRRVVAVLGGGAER